MNLSIRSAVTVLIRANHINSIRLRYQHTAHTYKHKHVAKPAPRIDNKDNDTSSKPKTYTKPNTIHNFTVKHSTIHSTPSYILPDHHLDQRKQYYITDEQQLTTLCNDICDIDILCVDTEFVSFPRYSPELQLVQLSTNKLIAIVDCANVTLQPHLAQFIKLLNTKTLIVHSGKYDIELLHKLSVKHNITPVLPNAIFDTQVACSVLGISNMISLKDMVSKLHNIDLDKSDTFTDWSKRPLSVSQLQYALNDVRYLYQCYTILYQQLIDTNRMSLFQTICSELLSLETYAPVDLNNIWRSIYLSKKLPSQSIELTIFQQVCIFREQLAQSLDWAPHTLLRNEVCFAVAVQQPTTLDALSNIQGMKPTFVYRHGHKMLQLVRDSKHIAKENRPVHQFDARDSSRLNISLVNLLNSWKYTVAATMKINPFVLGSTKDMDEIASCSQQAIDIVLKQKLQQSNNSTTTNDTSTTSPSSLAIVSHVFQQKPDVTVQQEVELLMSLDILNDWRLHSVGLDLLRIALGKSVQWSNQSNQLEWAERLLNK